MSILSLNVNTTGLVGSSVAPRRCTMVTTDSLATITTAGYLNNQNTAGNNIFPTDVFDVIYSCNSTTLVGTFGIFTVTQGSNGLLTLVSWANPGDVLLPVVSGDFANFHGTTGQIYDEGYSPSNAAKTKVVMANGATVANHIMVSTDTAGTSGNLTGTAINDGSVQAGRSTVAGSLVSFPSTATTGSLSLTAVSNSGNYSNVISNASTAQAITWSLQDSGTATSNIAQSPAALVNNNLVKASGTLGLLADSGISSASISGAITQLGSLYQVSATFNTAQMVTAYDTPLQIVANPSASQLIIVHSASVYVASTGHTAYATGTAPIIQYSSGGTNGAHGAGTIATASGLVAGDITAASSQVRTLLQAASAAVTGLSGLGIYFSNATGNYTAGTGTNVTITLVYELLTATV